MKTIGHSPKWANFETMRIQILCFLAPWLSIFLVGCGTVTTNPIEKALASKNENIRRVVHNLGTHEVQILFSKIEKDSSGAASFNEFKFQVNDSNYFYPASTVKFPVAILALEKLATMPETINRNTFYQFRGDSTRTTLSQDIIKIFAVSDNDAYNRIFEFLGKDYINTQLHRKGIKARISHRLSVENSADLNHKTIDFYINDSIVFTHKNTTARAIKPLELRQLKKGIGYTINDSLVKKPMDFSKKNYLPIESLYGIMKRIIFPAYFSTNEQFHINDADRAFLINAMAMVPKEAGYDNDAYYDSYVKFFVVGDNKAEIPQHIKLYNKVGYAYGYLTDCAYIVNSKTNTSYIITATIHVNENRIYNDGIYEYETVGIPFLAELGRQLINLKME